MIGRFAACAAGLSLVLAASAQAGRAPTPGESSAIRSTVTSWLRLPGSPAAKDNRIVSLRVSTADGRFAAVRLGSKSAGPSDLVLHRSLGTWWVTAFGSSVQCSAAPASVLHDLHIGCSPPNGVAWISDCGPLVSAPQELVLACADANYGLSHLRWRAWGAVTTTASGVVRANDCKPYCAAGHFHTYAVTVTASRLTACGRARYYALLEIAYAVRPPAGVARHDVHRLGC